MKLVGQTMADAEFPEMVDRKRVELLSPGCKPGVLPLN